MPKNIMKLVINPNDLLLTCHKKVFYSLILFNVGIYYLQHYCTVNSAIPQMWGSVLRNDVSYLYLFQL